VNALRSRSLSAGGRTVPAGVKTILRRGRNCWRISRAREAGLLVDGRSYYRAFCNAAWQARRYVLLAGWQFDTELQLLRGDDAAPPAWFLPFLNALCERTPGLRVYILAWDFSVFYSLKREFLQSLQFAWKSRAGIQFRFDSSHPLGASHHQKFVVVDGRVAFVGGMDLCQGVWDDRLHCAENALRVHPDGKPYPPRHDVQACVTGRVAWRLARLFARRWRRSGGGRLWLRPPVRRAVGVPTDLPPAGHPVAISRTQGEMLVPRQKPIMEVRRLFLDAIAAAESLLYIEQQYFAAQAVYMALVERMRAVDRPRLQIVMLLPRQPEALIEEIGLASVQAEYLHNLTDVAAQTGHALGIYNTRAGGDNPDGTRTFIHAKLLIADDRFLTVGSANFSNRSMGFDSELNLAWEAPLPRHRALAESIRTTRVDLLAEHCGLKRATDRQRLAEVKGLVTYLDTLADHPDYRLCHHSIDQSRVHEWAAHLGLHDLIIDPEKSALAEKVDGLIAADENGLFAKGISFLNQHLFLK